MTEKLIKQFEIQINDLECQVAFQEQAIESLNNSLSAQQLLITKMQDQIKYLACKINNFEPSNMADPLKEPPPPHY